MKKKCYFIITTLLLISILITDYYLSFYGKGNTIFNTKITYGYNTDFDKLEGFKIEEDGFIQVIGFGTKINSKIKIERIIEYTYDSDGIYCKFIDNNKKVNFVKVTYDKNRPSGFKIYYQLIAKSHVNKNLTWFTVYNAQTTKYITLFNSLLKLLISISIVAFMVNYIKNKL